MGIFQAQSIAMAAKPEALQAELVVGSIMADSD
jgi:hypothetical protein